MNEDVKPGQAAKEAKPEAPARGSMASRLRQEMPPLRTVFLWSEILGSPRSRQRRR